MNLPIGLVLIEDKLITNNDLEEAIMYQKENPSKRLGEILIEKGYVSEVDFFHALAKRLKIPFSKLSDYKVSMDAVSLVDLDFAKENQFFPIDIIDNTLLIATTDPTNYYLLDDIKIKTGYEVSPIMTTKSDIEASIKTYYNVTGYSEVVKSINDKFSENIESVLNMQTENEIQNTPIVKVVNEIIDSAFRLNASDIHIEPRKADIKIRMRIDGNLIEYMKLNQGAHQSLVTRIKILGNMDIAEKRLPQDGRFSITYKSREIDIRVSTIPTVLGEKLVLRILGGAEGILTKSQLGFTKSNEELYNKVINSVHGIILVCGPTGSGKTTTLYSMLNEISSNNLNTITIEDPVEYKIDGINQIQVNNRAGLTFAKGLRSILRQDPDIIMIGEIRDAETAEIAVRSSITGHKVLSTIHTNDSIGAIARLADMGVEKYLISSSLVGVIGQRLVKTLCKLCKNKIITDEYETKLLNLSKPATVYEPVGCEHCNLTGYKGRIPVHEIIIINKEIRRLINTDASADDIKAVAKAQGFTSLRDNCIEHVLNGDVSIQSFLDAAYAVD